MDQSQAPLVQALGEYHEQDRYGFTPPGHRQGRGIDPRVREVMGVEPFRDELLVSAGLDDRSSSGGYLKQAEALVAHALDDENRQAAAELADIPRRVAAEASRVVDDLRSQLADMKQRLDLERLLPERQRLRPHPQLLRLVAVTAGSAVRHGGQAGRHGDGPGGHP